MVVSELAGQGVASSEGRVDGAGHIGRRRGHTGHLDDIKHREACGYTYEVADGSLALLIMRHLGTYRPAFTLESFRGIVDDREDVGALAKDAASEATIKIHVGDERFCCHRRRHGPHRRP